MAAHEVDITLPKREIGRADAIFDVKADGVTLGALHVSRGAVVWFPAGTTYGYKTSWSKFDEIMQENGSRTEAR
jgi:hypothetical protein